MIRVLHCPTMVGGNPQALARAERKHGLASWSIVLQGTQYAFQTDEQILPAQAGRLAREFKRWPLLWRAYREYDLIHFNYGLSLAPAWNASSMAKAYSWPLRLAYRGYARCLEQIDLPFLRRSGKGLVVTYQGDDARQGDYCRANFEICIAKEVGPEYYSDSSDSAKRRQIRVFSRYADRIYALNPDLLHVLPEGARFLPYANADLDEWKPVANSTAVDRPVVLHAPTHTGAKGTKYVLEAVNRIRAEGIEFEFILIQNTPYAEVRRLYEKADILIDQLLCGWYGGLAVELMALGKPVICYIRKEDLRFIPAAMAAELPVICATPLSIYSVLKEQLTVLRSSLRGLAARSRAYVEHWHNPFKIAGELKQDYEMILAGKQVNKLKACG